MLASIVSTRAGRLAAAEVRVTLLLFVAALAMRFAAFGNPLAGSDEQFYLLVGQRMLDGALPYVDVWDRKPLGLFLLYAAAAKTPWPVEAYQVLALLCVTATARLIVAIAGLLGWKRGAFPAALCYCAWLNLAGGINGQAPLFYNLLTATAAWLALRGLTRPGVHPRRDGVLAMGLMGLALQIKYSVVLEGLALGLLLLLASWRACPRVPVLLANAALWITAALLPTALALGFYALKGQEQAFVFANFVSIFLRGGDPPADQLANLQAIGAVLAPLLIPAIVGLWRARAWPAAFWLAAAIVGMLMLGGWHRHYALPVVLPAAVGLAAFVSLQRHGPRIGIALVLVTALAGQVVTGHERIKRGGPDDLAPLAHAINEAPPGCLYIYSGPTALYSQSRRCTATRYLFPSHLQLLRERDAIGADPLAELARVLSARPAVIVTGPPRRGENPRAARMVRQTLESAYVPAACSALGRGKTFCAYWRRSAA